MYQGMQLSLEEETVFDGADFLGEVIGKTHTHSGGRQSQTLKEEMKELFLPRMVLKF